MQSRGHYSLKNAFWCTGTDSDYNLDPPELFPLLLPENACWCTGTESDYNLAPPEIFTLNTSGVQALTVTDILTHIHTQSTNLTHLQHLENQV